jgi:hypothetical protein
MAHTARAVYARFSSDHRWTKPKPQRRIRVITNALTAWAADCSRLV